MDIASLAENKLPIDGLKLSQPMAQINLLAQNTSIVLEAFHRLAAQRINMPLVTLDATDGRWVAVCCIAVEDLVVARTELKGLGDDVEIISPVGSLTLFPHRSRQALLNRALAAFGDQDLPVHAVASSISSLALVTDYHRLETAAAAVKRVVSLPGKHAPMRSQVHVRQL